MVKASFLESVEVKGHVHILISLYEEIRRAFI